MTDDTHHGDDQFGPAMGHRRSILVFIFGCVFVAFSLVLASMALYNSSGAAQLDLSRPGYKSVQNEVDTEAFESFSATGDVTKQTLEQFLKLYKKQVKPVDNVDAFAPDALSEQALSIDAPSADN